MDGAAKDDMSKHAENFEPGRAVQVYIAIGSNLGDRAAILSASIRAIEALPATQVMGASSIFETDPVGPGPQGAYLNAAVEIETDYSAIDLLDSLQEIEIELGRDRSTAAQRWGPRAIDLDLLFYGDACIDSPRLVIPHPRAHERRFVTVPMAELAPDFVHPVLGRTMRALAAALEDDGSVCPWRRPSDWPSAR